MANLAEFMDFDDSAIPASTGVPDPVPPGDYMLQQDGSEIVATKNGTGMMLKCTFSVLTGEYEGRKVFSQFNIRNANAQAQAIGIGEFKALCLATGVSYEDAKLDTSLLDFQPFKAKVGYDKQQVNVSTGEPYPLKNQIKKFYQHGDAPAPVASNPAPAQPKPAASPAAAAAKPAAGALPWKKSA